MKIKIIIVFLITFVLSSFSQEIFMYGDNGEKIFFQEIDSIVQIKFRANTNINDKFQAIRNVDSDSEFEVSKISGINRLNLTIKNANFKIEELKKNNSIVYTNLSLLSDDGNIQIPTHKVLARLKSSKFDLEKILSKLEVNYEYFRRIGYNITSFLIVLKDGKSLNTANLLYESGYFEYAQPSFTRFFKPLNEHYSEQWGLNNTGQNGGTVGMDINAPEAWDITTGCRNIVVAVIDQGVDLDHPDLQGNLIAGFDATDGGLGGVNGDCWGDDAHGTACAGIIAAIDNTDGIIGVAPNCRISPIRAIYTNLAGNEQMEDDWAIDAINHAWQSDDADVLSCSWQYTNVPDLNTEINHALTLGRSGLGCVVVFAAGNNNSGVVYPANSNPDIIAVGAMSPCAERKRSSSSIWDVNPGVSTDPQGVSCDNEKWWGSNYGSQLDLVAPGVFIPTTDIQGTAGYNTATGSDGDYDLEFRGTSAATPHVAGVAALILSINPTLTQDEVRDIIESTSRKVGSYSYSTTTGRTNGKWNNQMGYGLLNAEAALKAALPSISGPSSVCSSGTSFSISDFPQGAALVWDESNNINRYSQGTNPCTFYSSGSGEGWIEATFNNTGCPTIDIPRKNVGVGVPNPNSFWVVGTDIYGNSVGSNGHFELCGGESYSFFLYPSYNLPSSHHKYGISSIDFYFDFDYDVLSEEYGRIDIHVYDIYDDQGGFIAITSECGGYDDTFKDLSFDEGSGCGGYFMLMPNPTDDYVKVTTKSLIESDNLNATSTNEPFETGTIKIFDSFGMLHSTVQLESKNQRISTSHLKNGVYVVEIKTKLRTERLNLAIMH